MAPSAVLVGLVGGEGFSCLQTVDGSRRRGGELARGLVNRLARDRRGGGLSRGRHAAFGQPVPPWCW